MPTQRKPSIIPFNGAYYDKDGQIHNLDGTVGDAANGCNLTPFTGVYIDHDGNPQNITDLLGGGGGGGGVTMAQVNAAVTVETNARVAADNIIRTSVSTEVTNRTNADAALQTSLTATANGLTTEITNRQNAITKEVSDRNAAIAVETAARIAADTAEVTARNTAISTAISTEVTNRNSAIATAISSITSGKLITQLIGSKMTRVINGSTTLAKSLFTDIASMSPGKCFINDSDGTIGIYESDVDSATISIRTITIDTVSGGADVPRLLGNVATKAALPLTVTDATTIFGRTPAEDDYANVLEDETHDGNLVRYYLISIDTSDNLAWGNELVIDTNNFQAQTALSDAGKVLTGGSASGTFGTSLSIDPTVTASSANLISSGAVATAIAAVPTNYQAQSAAADAGKILVGGATVGTFGTSLDVATTVAAGNNNPVTSDAVATAIAGFSPTGGATIQNETITGDDTTLFWAFTNSFNNTNLIVQVYDQNGDNVGVDINLTAANISITIAQALGVGVNLSIVAFGVVTS